MSKHNWQCNNCGLKWRGSDETLDEHLDKCPHYKKPEIQKMVDDFDRKFKTAQEEACGFHNYVCEACGFKTAKSLKELFTHLDTCEKYQNPNYKSIKLTPAQFAAIRWPTPADCEFAFVLHGGPTKEQLCHYIMWALKYALKDLMPDDNS